MSKKALNVQDDSRRKGIQGNTSKSEIKCVCLNARSIINKKTELNIMVDDIKPHIIGITESWANNAGLDIGYVPAGPHAFFRSSGQFGPQQFILCWPAGPVAFRSVANACTGTSFFCSRIACRRAMV